MAQYTRVTVLADQRNVELLLPDTVPVGELIPTILQHTHTDHQAQPRQLTLTPVGGATLSAQTTLRDANISDGASLTLNRRAEIIHSPVVYDLADSAAELSSFTQPFWKFAKSRLLDITLLTLLLPSLISVLTGPLAPETSLQIAAVTSAGLLLVMAILGQRILRTDLEFALPSAVLLGWALHESDLSIEATWLMFCGWLVALLAAVTISYRQWLAFIITISTGVLLAGLWLSVDVLAPSGAAVGLILGTLGVLLLGLVPRVALMLSGLSRLDDNLAGGERPTRLSVKDAVANAHTGMVGMIFLLSLSTLSAVYLMLDQRDNGWAVGLAFVILLLTGLRSRSMPLVLEKTALLATMLIGIMLWTLNLDHVLPGWFVPVLIAVAIIAVIAHRLTTVQTHVAAWLRIAARRLEMLLTIALFPLLLGAFGLYEQLASTFS